MNDQRRIRKHKRATACRWAGLFTALAALGACGTGLPGDVTVQEPVGLELRLEDGVATSPGFAPADAAATAPVTVTGATVNLRDVELDLPEGVHCVDLPATSPVGRTGQCESGDDSATLAFEGPFRVDLMTGESSPPLERLVIPPGVYGRVDLRIDDVEEEATASADPMAGISLLAYGSYATATTVDVRVALKFNEDIRFEAPDAATGIAVGVEGGGAIVVRIVAQEWFSGIEETLETCRAAVGHGAAVLDIHEETDASECRQLEGILKENFKRAGQLDREESDDDEG